MKKLAIVVMLAVAGIALAQQVTGSSIVTPGLNPVCVTLKHKSKYLLQANVAAQDYTYNQYVFSSVGVFTTKTYTAAVDGTGGTAPTYVNDAGVNYWKVEPYIVLKDTDAFTFTATTPDLGLCYKAGTTDDGGFSAMTLTINEVVR